MTKRKAASTAPARPTNTLAVGMHLRDLPAARDGIVRVVWIEALDLPTGKRGEHPIATILSQPSGVRSKTRQETLANTALYAILTADEVTALLAQAHEPEARSTVNMTSITLRVGHAQAPVLRRLLESMVKTRFLDSTLHLLSDSERAVCNRLLDQLPRPEAPPASDP